MKQSGSLERISENGFPTADDVQSRPDLKNLNFDKYRDGDFDHYVGHVIKCLIYKDEKRIVYLDENCDVQWGENVSEPPVGLTSVLNRACEIEQMPDKHLSKYQLETAHRYVGEAIARALKGDHAAANEILEKAELWIKLRNEELGRIWQLTGSFITVAIAILAGILLLIFSSPVEQMLHVTTLDVLFGGFAGCFGAFLSLASRTGKLKLDSSAGRILHTIEGGVRVVTGGGSAVFVVFAIKANLLLGVINSTSVQFPLLITLCIAAGFSERFVPGFVRTLESQVIQKETKNPNN